MTALLNTVPDQEPQITTEDYGMPTLTKEMVVNAFDRRDKKNLKVPDLSLIDFSRRDFLGWRNEGNRCGYIVYPYNGELKGIVLSSTTRSVGGSARMCDLCITTHTSSDVTLYTVVTKVDPNVTVGLYICTDLACSQYARGDKLPRLPKGPTRNDPRDRIVRIRTQLDGFFDRIFTRP